MEEGSVSSEELEPLLIAVRLGYDYMLANALIDLLLDWLSEHCCNGWMCAFVCAFAMFRWLPVCIKEWFPVLLAWFCQLFILITVSWLFLECLSLFVLEVTFLPKSKFSWDNFLSTVRKKCAFVSACVLFVCTLAWNSNQRSVVQRLYKEWERRQSGWQLWGQH